MLARERASSKEPSPPLDSDILLSTSSVLSPIEVSNESEATSSSVMSKRAVDSSISESNGSDGPPAKRQRTNFNPKPEMTAYESAMLAATIEANEKRTKEMVRFGSERNENSLRFQEKCLELLEKHLSNSNK
ncbi:uncharacterized protein LOC117782609 [Drosophila innubila]|uniref:uncharacterized protein LOC117782609 n=1 Tax=Drosophila innubila TaxID=198719 RepID=UPI00148E71E1|nr:uncharacterized protein LOC117782609 [Drosophila innubila]